MRATCVSLLLLGACVARPPGEGPIVFNLPEHWAEAPLVPPVRTGFAVVTNNLDDTLSVFELADIEAGTLRQVARLPVGLTPVTLEGPHHVAAPERGDRFYVGLSNFAPGTGTGIHANHGTGVVDGYLLEFDGQTARQLRAVKVDRNPGDVTLSPDGRRALVSHFDVARVTRAGSFQSPDADSRLALIDVERMTVVKSVTVCPAAHGVKFSPDGRRAYVACFSDELAVVELESGAVRRVKVEPDAALAPPAKHEPYAVTLSPSGAEAWVSSVRSQRIQVVDTVTFTSRAFDFGGQPFFGAFTADGRTAYFPRQGDDALVELDAHTLEVRRVLPLRSLRCSNVHQVALLPGEQRALVVCEGDHQRAGSLLLVDLLKGLVLGAEPVGIFPDSVALLRAP